MDKYLHILTASAGLFCSLLQLHVCIGHFEMQDCYYFVCATIFILNTLFQLYVAFNYTLENGPIKTIEEDMLHNSWNIEKFQDEIFRQYLTFFKDLTQELNL